MTDLEFAKQVYQDGQYTFVIVRAGQALATGTRDGVGELLDVVAQRGGQARGAALADKIVGKAVAMVAAYAGIVEIYTPLASEAAEQTLREFGIGLSAERRVPLIRNKRNDGLCPLEQLALPLTTPADTVAALQAFAATRRQPLTI